MFFQNLFGAFAIEESLRLFSNSDFLMFMFFMEVVRNTQLSSVVQACVR